MSIVSLTCIECNNEIQNMNYIYSKRYPLSTYLGATLSDLLLSEHKHASSDSDNEQRCWSTEWFLCSCAESHYQDSMTASYNLSLGNMNKQSCKGGLQSLYVNMWINLQQAKKNAFSIFTYNIYKLGAMHAVSKCHMRGRFLQLFHDILWHGPSANLWQSRNEVMFIDVIPK